MGNSGSGSRGGRRGDSDLSIEDFECPKGFMSNIGVGGFGKVLAMVRKKDPSRHFAVKCMHKGKVIGKGQVSNCLNELDILRRLDHHAYLVNMFYAFQDKEFLYMCTDLMLGGTLQRAMRKAPNGHFGADLERVRRYTAELVLAVQYLHSQNVIHRDLKPDNVLLDANGRVHVTDFNVSLYIQPGNEETQRHEDGWGTRGYRAPEVYLRTGAGFIFACDWWSLGAMVFEMLTGKVPYPRLSREEPSSELLLRMNAEKADFAKIEDEITRDLVQKLLRFDPELRLGCQHGCNSEVMIMTHPFFEPIDWDELERYKGHSGHDRATASTDDAARTSTESPPTPSPKSGRRSGDGSKDGSRDAEQESESKQQQQNGGSKTIMDYSENFDASLDHKERVRILQRNMGILGLNGFNGDDDDEEDYPPVTKEQQRQFKDWAFNVDFKLEQQQKPQFTLLQTVSSMNPDQIRHWIVDSKPMELKALCSEMKAYREQAMKENFDHVMAEIRIDRLIEENLRLTRKIAELEVQVGVSTPTSPSDASLGFRASPLDVPAIASSQSAADAVTRDNLRAKPLASPSSPVDKDTVHKLGLHHEASNAALVAPNPRKNSEDSATTTGGGEEEAASPPSPPSPKPTKTLDLGSPIPSTEDEF